MPFCTQVGHTGPLRPSETGRRPIPYIDQVALDFLFGTNHPMLSASQALADVDALELDDEASGLFLRGNAERVFGLR